MAAGTKMGNDAILFYLLTYLFANIGACRRDRHGQAIGSEEINDYSGLNRRSPFLAFSMLLFLLSWRRAALSRVYRQIYIFVAASRKGSIPHYRRAREYRDFHVLPDRVKENVHCRAD